jgi:hypothetical protein
MFDWGVSAWYDTGARVGARARGRPGAAVTVVVDGRPCEARVETEGCNCRGDGWHEHRFRLLPKAAGVRAGQRAVIVVEGEARGARNA